MRPAAVAISALDPSSSANAFFARGVAVLQAAPSTAAFARELANAKNVVGETGAFRVALVPSNALDLILVACFAKVDRIVVWHEHGPEDASVKASAVRAAFALVDSTVVPDLRAEKDAVRLGADPERVVHLDDEVIDRVLLEPPRRTRRRGAFEFAASLALDAAQLSGMLRLLELASAKRGVNVVNYHRILPLSEIVTYCRPQMALAEPIFEAQIDLIAQVHGFTPIDRVRDDASIGRVAITFDDGYEDNYRVALPILQKFSTPACIFIVTNLIGMPNALWWDRLGLALFAYWRGGCAVPLPERLPAVARELPSSTSFDRTRALISEAISALNLCSTEDRDRAVAAAESIVPKLENVRTMLSWEEVRSMANNGIAFGGHTRNHVPLDELSLDSARDELFGSQHDLDEHIGREQPGVVALPRGRLGPLSESEIREQGVRGVMTTDPGVNKVREDSLFVLRRDGRALTLHGRHHPAKLRLELTGVVDRIRSAFWSDPTYFS